jgi:uncharacterized protein (TIGR02246 family)
LIAVVVGCQQQPPPAPPDTRAADEAAIRAASGAWLKAASEKDVDKIVSFFAADAQGFYPGAAPVTGAEAIRQSWSNNFADPNYAVTWQTSKVKVARSGDVGYEMGTYEETKSDARKRPQAGKGNYVTVWEKQADGKWKVTADMATPVQ